ncbi:MAG: dihydroneopterin aldolase [Bacteroidetes bacterium]|nr:dihydroneopterin aldolase [Bacteroidota bacterium]
MKGTIAFNNIRLFGYHGSHSEEAMTGNFFTINITAHLKTDFAVEAPDLTNSVNYELLHSVVLKVFEFRESMIENVAINILKALKSEFPQVLSWKISISKTNPVGAGSFFPEFIIEE